MITLTANNSTEAIIKDYLDANASESLTEKINAGTKTLAGCIDYITRQAKQKARNGCAMVEDKIVFGWAVHFFEEDEIKEVENAPKMAKIEHKTPKNEQKVTKNEQKVTKTEQKETMQLAGQMSIFDYLGG